MMARALVVHLLDASARSFVLALLAAAGMWAWRRRAPTAAHSIWTIVLGGMLALAVLGPAVPPIALRVLQPAASPETAIPGRIYLLALLAWATVAGACGVRLLTGLWLARRLARSGVPVMDGVYESTEVAVPLTVGWLPPKILLPVDWRAWDRTKLQAVVTHERAHVRRRDGLVVLLAGLNRCVFWFHPLAWWIERQLALLAEQSCDEECIAAIGDRERYAQVLVEIAGAMESAGGRVARQALAMANASHIGQRIGMILEEPCSSSRRLTRGGWMALAACGIPLLYAAAAIRVVPRPALLAFEFPHWASPVPPANVTAARIPEPTDRDLYRAVVHETNPRRRLALLELSKVKYPHSRLNWLQLYLNTYSQLNDIPNLLAALNQMGRQEFMKTLRIDPAPKALYYYARAAAYEGPGSLAADGRQQADDYLRKAYASAFGENEVGLDELKRLAKSYPFPPQYFQIAALPPPSRTFDATLAAENSSIQIRNQCPYGLRIDCNGPERRRAWIAAGADSQIVLAAGSYQIYAADAKGVSSFTGPGRFDPQFAYAYTLSLKRD